MGFAIANTGPSGGTYRVKHGSRDYGYFNGSVLKSGAVLGYHFPDPKPHGNDACPKDQESNLVEKFAEQHGCENGDVRINRVGGANAGRVFLHILEPSVAFNIIKTEAGFSAGGENDTVLVKVGTTYVEGRLIETQMHRRERDRKARIACLEAHGFNCFACGENLRLLYKGLPVEVVHVHHEEPLSEVIGERTFDPVQTMKPLCPNCHCVIHSKWPAYTVFEVRRMRRGET